MQRGYHTAVCEAGIVPPAVHLPAQGATLRANTWGHAYRLTEVPPSTNVLDVVRWLAVEQSPRYRPKRATTYCNVYAYDVACAVGGYLPRVWWVPSALAEIERARDVAPLYGRTVGELNANSLHRWFETWGTCFGWMRIESVDQAQREANDGALVAITARRREESASGHISIVAPESEGARAVRLGGRVTLPVQSMAGGRLLELGTGTAWWKGQEFAAFGFWVRRATS